ncbi:MAG: hypothetical protein QOI12_4222 [Alphaproteobacteria bacterium]|jgi:hypothetical protein|nr:hypothetical protein [Alphaproteobacteria bacterium]
MRPRTRLGPANLALISLYFVPAWGTDALRALLSPYSGFDDRAHAAASIYLRQVFDFGLDGLMRASCILAGIKLVIAAAFVAYLIEFVRSLVVGREPDRETLDAVLLLAVVAIVIWALPALALDDKALMRLYATQLLLVAGAVIVITVEGHILQAEAAASPGDEAAGHEPDAARRILVPVKLVPAGPRR